MSSSAIIVPHAQPRFADWFGSHDQQGRCCGARISTEGGVIDEQCGRWRGDTLEAAEPVDYRYLPENAPLHHDIARASAAELSGGKRQLLYPSSGCYIGGIAGGLPQGAGSLHCVNGGKLTGSWQEGKLEGQGAIQYANGDHYDGAFLNGFPHGVGRLTRADGTVYEGGWKECQKHGFGVQRDRNGTISVCGWWESSTRQIRWCPVPLSALPADTTCVPLEVRARLVDGRQLFLTPDNTHLLAEAQGDQPHGAGVEYDRRGGQVGSGRWRDGKRHGRGWEIFDDEDGCRFEYEGDFSADLPDGAGRMTYPDDSVYEGGWRAGKKHGFGVLRNKDGKLKCCGLYNAGKFVLSCLVPRNALLSPFASLPADVKRAIAPQGHEQRRMSDGSIHVGVLRDGQPCGSGFRIYPDHRLVSGDAWSGDQLAEGTVRYLSNNTYEGQLRDGLPHGAGTMNIKSSGESLAGEFENEDFVLGVELDSDGRVTQQGRWDDEGKCHAAPLPVSVLSRLPADIKLKIGITAESALLFPPGHPDGAHTYAGQLNSLHQRHGLGSMLDAAGQRIAGQCGVWWHGKLLRSFHAHLIGNDAYLSGTKLSGCVRDVERLRAALERLGFHVTLLRNGTEAQMKEGIEDFAASLTSGCVAWFFFSGHGNSTAGRREYMVSVDLRGRPLDSSLLFHSNLMDALAAGGGKEALYILTFDCCRGSEEMAASDDSAMEYSSDDENGASLASDATSDDENDNDAPVAGKQKRSASSSKRAVRQQSVDTSRCQFITGFACAPNHVAHESGTDEVHGVYTRALCEVLESMQPGADSSITRVFTRIMQLCNTRPGRKQRVEYSNALAEDADWQLLPKTSF